MKVYIIIENGVDIRLVTLNKELATQIVNCFEYQILVIEERELIGLEK